jgi:ribosome-binding factor A
MDSKRSERVGDLLVEFVSHMLNREVSDPRIGAITITGARVSRDLRHAWIYFRSLGEKEAQPEVLQGLKSASRFIRSKAARELRLRFVPAIEFVYDDTQDQAQRIEELLRLTKNNQ